MLVPAYSLYGVPFSTIDADNDWKEDRHCASVGGGGGWWFGPGCSESSLNGRWGAGGREGMFWWPMTFDYGPPVVSPTRMLVSCFIILF